MPRPPNLRLGISGKSALIELYRVDGVERIQKLLQPFGVHVPPQLGCPRFDVGIVNVHIGLPIKNPFEFLYSLGEFPGKVLDSFGLGLNIIGGLHPAKN